MISETLFSQSIRPIYRRLQTRESIRVGWMTVGVGLGITTLLLAAGRLTPLLMAGQLLAIGLSFTLFLAVTGQLWVWMRSVPVTMVARMGDAQLGLDERLTTALELLEGRLDTSAELRQAQLTDTLAHLQRAPIAAAFPLAETRQTTRIGLVFAALITVMALLVWLPNPQTDVLRQRRQLDETIEAQIEQLQQLQLDLLAQTEAVQATQIEPLTDTLAELLDKLESARANHSAGEALAALSDAKRELSQMDATRQAQSLDAVANALAQSDAATAQQMADALKNGDAQQAADALAQAGSTTSDSAESQSLAAALNAAAQAAASDNPALAQSLQAAADALQQASGDAQSVQDALDAAAQQLADAGAAEQAAAQAAQQALQNIQQAQQALAQQAGGTGGAQRTLGDGQNGGVGADTQNGQGGGNGSGRGEPGAGNDGLYSAQGTNGIIPTNNGANQNRLEDYSSVFAPDHLGGSGGDFLQPDPQNPEGGIDVGEVPADPNRDPGEASVPYTDVFREYSNQANSALATDAIPLGMKDYVRQYFGALEP